MPFALEDLRFALAWAAAKPNLRLTIKLDCISIPELLEIYPIGSPTQRWVIWRTYNGRLRVDDWGKNEFGLPYSTVETALEFIATLL